MAILVKTKCSATALPIGLTSCGPRGTVARNRYVCRWIIKTARSRAVYRSPPVCHCATRNGAVGHKFGLIRHTFPCALNKFICVIEKQGWDCARDDIFRDVSEDVLIKSMGCAKIGQTIGADYEQKKST